MAQPRRLHELLQEPQEPFFVDAYLIERGYSTKLLEAQEGLSLCWPHNVSKNQVRPRRDDLTRKRGGFGRGFLTKIVYWQFVKKNMKCEKEALKDRISPNHERILKSHCFVEESESETKNLSPVSVLEMHRCEVSPAHSNDKEEKPQKILSLIDSPKKAFNILEELLRLAYDPSMNYISESTQNVSKEQKASDIDQDWDLNSDESTTDEEGSSFSLDKETFGEIQEIVISELAESMTNWGNFKFDMNKEIGTEIEGAIFEEIIDDLVLDILKSNCTNERC
ncbi:hypothetical protein LUZ63_017763 [Rhynchospora breviuscula]|uniref:DUF4378 domain-containing protein n=1 Tax=Rhynchospora breviuscula TaxID=2022672 RepID=A0A9Q0C322_9POAL|nr:hypothetical protein LUZ63_017763 [Rhynchospora breviuscula]